ncbi:transcriptional regulator, partial [Methanocorpusculum sp.]|nr:transcriptional regulator [Methanocorpusculum sp.]
VMPIDLLNYVPVEEERVPASLPSAHTEGESQEKPEEHLRSIGISVHELRRAPFHAFAVFENETILTCYGTPQKTVQRAELLGNISQISGTHSLCVVTDYSKEKKIGKTLVIGDKRLKDVEDGEDLLSMVSERS